MAAASATGEKLPMFVIGTSKNPRCFNCLKNLPCHYRAQAKSWMGSFLFEEWVKELDKRFVHEDGKVALIIDHCPAHTRIEGINAVIVCEEKQPRSNWRLGKVEEIIRGKDGHVRGPSLRVIT